MCVLKHSHKAQILEHDESLSEGSCLLSCACTGCPGRGCGLCEHPAVLLAGRGSLQGNRVPVPSAVITGKPLQVTVPAHCAVLCQSQGYVMLFLSSPVPSQDVSGQGSPDVSRSCLHSQGCPYPVWPPSVCLWKTMCTLKVISLYKG